MGHPRILLASSTTWEGLRPYAIMAKLVKCGLAYAKVKMQIDSLHSFTITSFLFVPLFGHWHFAVDNGCYQTDVGDSRPPKGLGSSLPPVAVAFFHIDSHKSQLPLPSKSRRARDLLLLL